MVKLATLKRVNRWSVGLERVVVFDDRQKGLIYARKDIFSGALCPPNKILFDRISRVQLSVYSATDLEIDGLYSPEDLALASTKPRVRKTHVFRCSSQSEGEMYVHLVHKASPRLQDDGRRPIKPPKPPHILAPS